MATELSQATDADVAREVADGGEAASAAEAELCRRFLNRARLYGIRHLARNVTAAEDLAQQVMMSVLQALREKRVAELEKIDRFVLGTSRNVAHGMRRREVRDSRIRLRLAAESATRVQPPWEAVLPRRVEECLAGLPARDARLLGLLFQEGLSAAEAADALDTTPGNVRVLRHRAIARLRDCVDAAGEAGA